MLFLFHLSYFREYVCGCFYEKESVCMIVTWLLYYIQSIDWLFTCFNMYIASCYLNYCSWYVCGCLTRSDYSVWLWDYYYHIFSSLINSILALIFMVFLSIWIIVACMLEDDFTRDNFSAWCWNDNYLISSSFNGFFLALIWILSFLLAL